VKKTEKLIASIVAIALGILLIVLKSSTVQVITSILGILLLVLGVLDFLSRESQTGMLKCFAGIFVLAFSWLILSAVLYAVAAMLMVAAVWWVYELWRTSCLRSFSYHALLMYARPLLLALIGVFLLFHSGEERGWVFTFAGIFTILEGALLFAVAVKTIE
jgi:uncharacterized membrane protein HdeD (DUF308 family)